MAGRSVRRAPGRADAVEMAVYVHVGVRSCVVLRIKADKDAIRAVLGSIVFGSLALLLPPEDPTSGLESMDWIGSALGISGLITFNFVWKYVSHPNPHPTRPR